MDPVIEDLGEDGVLQVTLNRPDRRNAIDNELAAALRVAFENAADNSAVRAIVLTGKGKAFSAGGDLSRFERDWDPREFRHDSHRLTSLITLVERIEKPTVAAINGVTTGAGTQLALACDLRLMAAGTRFVYREGRLGIIPSHGGITRLVKLDRPRPRTRRDPRRRGAHRRERLPDRPHQRRDRGRHPRRRA